MLSGTLDSSDVLPSHPFISLASPIIIILISPLKHTHLQFIRILKGNRRFLRVPGMDHGEQTRGKGAGKVQTYTQTHEAQVNKLVGIMDGLFK